MKKFLTLFALLACFMGVKAVEIVDAEVDFSKYTDISEVKFAGWGASESAMARLSIQDGCLHFHSEEATDPSWDCQFHPIGFGANAEPDVTYTLHFKIKGTVAQNVSMLGFGQTPYGQFPITTEWVEGTVDYVATNTSGDILMQCGDYVGDWDIAYLKITHEGKEERPIEWVEQLANGDAETPWANPNTAFNDMENNLNICAWGKVKGVNTDDDGNSNPFPATIEAEGDDNHVFVVHAAVADTEGDASAWDNQFWIESPKQLKVGSQFKLHFRYKASEAATVGTQYHHQSPSNYAHYQAIGDINFTTGWQEFDQIITVPEQATDTYSIAFNLNSQNKNAIDFYFDDISLSFMKLEEGLFVASSNTVTGIEYDFDNAIALEYDDDLAAYVATVGTAGKEDTWVNEVMVSTVRGNDRAFKAGTIKPSGAIDGTEETWLNYAEGSNAKVKLPAAGVWRIAVDTENIQMNFYMIEGEQIAEPLEEIPNPTEVVVKGKERDDLADSTDNDGNPVINEEEGGTGQPWDNQFFIVANRTLKAGETTIIKFKYKSSIPATSGTQLHGDPGAYKHYEALGTFNFTEDWQEFETTLTIPSAADGMKSIAFNMAEIKPACDYYIKDVVWMLEDKTERLVNPEGTENFFVKEGANTAIYQFGTNPGGGETIPGDVNGDSAVDVSDISAIISVMAGDAEYDAADVNGDGAVDVSDISSVITIMAGGKLGE